jgi:hypothetical protein
MILLNTRRLQNCTDLPLALVFLLIALRGALQIILGHDGEAARFFLFGDLFNFFRRKH